LWSKIAVYTNKRAAQSDQDSKRAWYPTSGAEMKAWFATVIWWCLVRNITFEDFFKMEVDPTRLKRWFSTLKRWKQIKRFMKWSDCNLDPHNKHDRLYRIREIFDVFIGACRQNYWPGVEIALDEAIKKFKGRCVFKQYIKNKPVRWGFKIFCICCSATAYLWNAMFYLGKKEDEPKAGNSVTTQTVLKLLEPLAQMNHRVHMDNYYTGLPLCSTVCFIYYHTAPEYLPEQFKGQLEQKK
jgi:hypothetical protein